MINVYQAHLESVCEMEDNSTKLNFLTCTLRSLLQVASTSSLEVVKELTPTEDPNLDSLIERFRRPSDGMPIEILDKTIPIIRTYVDKNFMTGWFENFKSLQTPVCKQLQEWVQFRNKRTGHGVLDQKHTTEWANKTELLIKSCLLVFKQVIPSVTQDKQLNIAVNNSNLNIDTPLFIDDHAIVITSVEQKKSRWKMKAQLLSFSNAEEKTLELSEKNVFSNLDNVTDIYKLIEVNNNNQDYILEHNTPIRQTDVFEGRVDELLVLKDWLDDEDSRRCLIYGDGGYGKTTLVLECLNQLIEGSLNISRPLPSVICYYTAKKTRWTSEGITYFTSIEPIIDESIRELIRCLHTVLPKDWYTTSGKALVNKAVTELKKNNYSRDDVLIVLDNTETLATTSQQTRELGQLIEMIGKSVGRVIITSRRQESIEAKQLLIEGLSTEDCINLLRALAVEYKAEAISKSGDATLRKISEKLMKKPILLEALVVYIGRAKVGIEAALDSLYRKSNDELLEFLYDDAWERIGEQQKETFYVIVSLTCPLDKYSISRACQLIEIQHSEFQTSLVETHFSNITDYGSYYEIELVELAQRFFQKKLSEQAKGIQDKIKGIASEVTKYSSKRHDIELAYKKDRVAEAFRNEFAKAAKIASDKDDINTAIEMYKLAIEEDPLNSALHDRFAWILFNKTKDYPLAKNMAEKAVKLNPRNCDAIVNLALINYLLDEIQIGDSLIDDSTKLGRTQSFALLRKAIARFHKARNMDNIKEAVELNIEAQGMLSTAEKHNKLNDGYDAKNLQNIRKHQALLRKQALAFEKQIRKNQKM
jgi:tetratricopeptide (TPR) repeat protein